MSLGIHWGSLRWKIIAWSFVPTAIILAAVALVGFLAYEQVTENLTISNSRELVRLSAGQLATEFSEYGKVLTMVARTPELTDLNPAMQHTALKNASNRLAIFDAGVLILDNTGIVVATEPERKDLLGLNLSGSDTFREMIKSPGTIFSTADLPNHYDVLVAVPITGAQGEMFGILAGMFRTGANSVSSFYGSIVKLRLSEETAYLVDQRGIVLYHTDANRIGEDYSGQSVMPLLATEKSGAFRTRDFAGNEIVAAYAPVPGTPWGLVIEQNWSTLLLSGQSYGPFLLLLLALGLIAPAIVVTFGTQKITEPIQQLIVATKQVADGNLGKAINVRTGDELEKLGKQFNQMSAQLAESYRTLQAREERLALVLEGTNDGIWDWDLRTNDVYYSPRWKSMLGYEDHEIPNRFEAWRDLIHPDDIERAMNQVRTELEEHTSAYELEHRLRCKDGSYRWILARGVALRDAQGVAYRMTGSHTDITERKRAEEDIRQSEKRFAQVFHANPLPISITTLDGRYIDVNDAWLRLMEYSRAEVIGKTVHDLELWVQPEKRAPMIQQLQATGSVRDYEHQARTKSGAVRDVLVSAEAIEFNNTRYNLALVHDITERKRAEEAVRRQNAYLEALHQVTLGVVSELDATELLGTIVQRAVDLVGASYGWVYLVTPEQDAVELKVATGVFYRHIGARLKRGEGLAGHIWQTGESLAIEDYQIWAERSAQFEGDPMRAVMGAPLKLGNQVTGVIGLTNTSAGNPFQRDELDLMTRFAELASIALQNARLHTSLQGELNERKRAETALQERLVFERLITNISTEFINLSSDQIDSGIEQALAAIGRFTGSDRSYVFRFSTDGKQMDNLHEWCRNGILAIKSIYQNQPAGLLPWTTSQIRRNQVVHVPRLADLPPEAQGDCERMQSHKDAPLSFINVPMVYHGNVIGLLGFDSVRAEKTWSEDSIALLRIVGEIFVNALEHKRAAEELRKSELRFRTMFENAGIGMAITEQDDRIVQANPALCKMLGYSTEELSHLHAQDYTHPEDLPNQQLLENQVVAGQRDHYQIEKRYIRKDGQVMWGRLIRSVVRDAQGKMLYRIGMVEDITEERQAKQIIEEAYRTMEQQVEERTHELATLNAIVSTVSRSLDLKEIMRDALCEMTEITNMEYGIAYRLASEEGDALKNSYLQVMAYCGFPDRFANFGDGLPFRESAAGVAGQKGEPMLWSLAELPTHDSLKQMLAEEGVQQVVSIPLTAKGQFVGALNLSTRQMRSFTPDQLDLLKTIGQQVGVAVENARLYEQAERSAQAAERSRLARELHDSVTQSLYSMTLYAEAGARLLIAGHHQEAAGHLRDLRDTAQEALREMRLLIFELRPPALESGLATALQTRLDSVESRGGIQAELQVEGEEHLSPAMQMEIYNIAVEALNNALKHAQARRVQVHLCFEPASVSLEINDDGVGFDPTIARQGGGLGIAGMRERAQRIGGKLEITSAVGKGTKVSVHVSPNKQATEEQ